MNEQHRLYVAMTNKLHKYLNNHGNDEADYQSYAYAREKYKEYIKNE